MYVINVDFVVSDVDDDDVIVVFIVVSSSHDISFFLDTPLFSFNILRVACWSVKSARH